MEVMLVQDSNKYTEVFGIFSSVDAIKKAFPDFKTEDNTLKWLWYFTSENKRYCVSRYVLNEREPKE